MLKKFISILLAAVLCSELCVTCLPTGTLRADTGTINTDRLNMRSGPGTNYSSIRMLSTNMKVEILDSVNGTDGRVWYKVNCGNTTGYIRGDFVSVNVVYAADDAAFEAYLNAQGFPESYRNSLRGLHSQHPNWVFMAMQTGLDWNEALKEESRVGLNLVDKNAISSWKSTESGGFDWVNDYWPGYDGASWVAASPALIAHYMDPRNFLTDPYVFQFEVQTYDPGSQTRSGLEQMVQGTFLEGYAVSKKSAGNGSSEGPASAGSGNPGPVNSGNTSPVTTAPAGSEKSVENNTFGPVISAPPEAKVSSVSFDLFSLLGGIRAYAGWEETAGNWYYRDSNGALRTNGWYWIDGNGDGISESYYFDAGGLMAKNCMVGDYQVNENGAWVVNGIVQTKKSEETKVSGTATYVDLLMEAAQKSGVSPYVLAAMIIQEQGKNGTSPLISGNYGSYAGYYNFYNINAYEHNGMTAVESGLKYASESGNGNRPWNTIEKAVIGGASAYGENYTNNGQDTFYLKKFNVQGNNKYKHQFMSNVIAAAQEGAKVANAYTPEIKEGARTFRIPVYNNMPDLPCELPSANGNPNNRLSSLFVDGFSLTPTFDHNLSEYSLVVNDTSSITVSATAINGNAQISGTGTYHLGVGLNQIDITVKAENGDLKTYRINVTRKQGTDMSSGEGLQQPAAVGPSNVSLPAVSQEQTPSSEVHIITGGSTGQSNSNAQISIGAPPGE